METTSFCSSKQHLLLPSPCYPQFPHTPGTVNLTQHEHCLLHVVRNYTSAVSSLLPFPRAHQEAEADGRKGLHQQPWSPEVEAEALQGAQAEGQRDHVDVHHHSQCGGPD